MALRHLSSLFQRMNKDINRVSRLHQSHGRRLYSNHSLKTSHRPPLIHTSCSNPFYNAYYPLLSHLIYRHHLSTLNSNRIDRNSLFSNHNIRRPSLSSNKPFLHSKRRASMDVSKDYYSILGVKKNSTKKEIRSSYLKLAKTWHPDLHKKDADKKRARDKFIGIQEAYEVLHDDQMRKKYDEMRRIGISQDQYVQREAYEKHTGFTGRGASAYNNQWEDHFRRNMHDEWEKIRREQQDWARSQRQQRHSYSSQQFPFGNPYERANPFGFQSNSAGGPFNQNPFQGHHQQPGNPLEGFFRTMILVFGVFMALKLTGAILFGPPRGRRDGFDPHNGPRRYRDESPYYSQSNYDKYNHNMPGPFSLNADKVRKGKYSDTEPIDEHFEDGRPRRVQRRKLNRSGQYVPPPPSMPQDYQNGPKPINPNRPRPDPNKTEMDIDDGNQIVFQNPNGQTTDISSPQDQRRRERKKRKSKYERLLEEQRMVEDVYIRARRKQMQEEEHERQRQMNKKFGRRRQMPPPAPPSNSKSDEDPNEAWERYLNGKRKSGRGGWRD